MAERDPVALDSTITTGESGAATPAPVPGGNRYVVEGEIGRGGIGVVLRARDRQLDRTVALKVPLRGSDAARLTAEAAITARLEHPSITPIYEAGRLPSGEPFYAMKLVEGRSLRDLLDEAGTLEARLALLPHLLAVAEALAYAHAHGVIHRDVKPANVLVGTLGETIVVDWGLAVAVPSDGEGAPPPGIVGTPAYMAPEQARGERADRRSDVYALGAVLHHLLRGRPPFKGPDALARAAAGPPEDLRRHPSGTPPDLAAILEKAMAADPAARYPAATELAADLRRFLLGQLVSSRRYRWWELASRFCRRHVATLTVAGALVCALLATGIVSVRRIAREQAQARRRYDEMVLAQARTAVGRDPTEALGWLRRYPTDGSDWASVRSLMVEAESSGAARAVYRGLVNATLSPEGDAVALLFTDGSARLVDGSGARGLWPKASAVGMLVFAADGSQLVAVGEDALLRWDVRAQRELPALAGAGSAELHHAAWSRDGRFVAAGAGSDVIVWDLAAGARRVLSGHAAQVHSVAFSPDGAWLASGSHDGTVRLWPLDGSGAPRVLRGHRDQVRPVEFSADGRTLLSAGNDGTLRVWDVATGAARVLGGADGIVYQARLLAGGRALSVGSDGALRLWDLAAGTQRIVLRAPQGLIALATTPDGSRVVVGGGDPALRVVDLETGMARLLLGHEGAVFHLRLSRDGNTLLSLGLDGTARLWDLSRPAPRALVSLPGPPLSALTPDGAWLALAGSDHLVRVCRVADGSCRTLGTHEGTLRRLRFFPDGERFLSCGDDGSVRLWRRQGGAGRVLYAGASKINDVVISPDGARLATAGDDGTVRVFDGDGNGAVALRHEDRVWSVDFSPDGERIVSGGLDFTVRLAGVDGSHARVLRGHHDWVMAARFSHDGRRVASASFDGTARVWDLQSGASQILDGNGGGLIGLEFSPDDRALLTFGNERVPRLWSLDDGSAWLLVGHRAVVRFARFSPDGRSIVTVSEDGGFHWWDLARRDDVVLRLAGERVYDVTWPRDGQTLITASDEGHVWVWPLAALPPVPRAPDALRAELARLSSVTLDDFAREASPLR